MALQIDGVCGEDSDTDAELLCLRPFLKPQKSMVIYLVNSGGEDESTPTLQAAQPVRTMTPTAPAIQMTIEMGAQPLPDPGSDSAATPPPKKSQKHAVADTRKVASAYAEIGQSPVMTSTRFATDVEELSGQR